MIEARQLIKRYGAKTAVDGISFSVQPGRVTGFLGPNGAGKSTTMRMIVGLDRPSGGEVTVNGKRYEAHAAPLREVGALLEAKAAHPGRSAYSHLLALARTHGIPKRRVHEVIDIVGLSGVAHKRAGAFSLGMGQRLGIAVALLGDPATLILDEPVNGLDPDGVLWVRRLLQRLAAEGRTVFVSSHLMSEMALVATHLIVIGRGKILADSGIEAFLDTAHENHIRVRSPQAPRLAEILTGLSAVVTAEADGALRVVEPCDRGGRRCGRRQRHCAARADRAACLARGRLHETDRRRDRLPRHRPADRRRSPLMVTLETAAAPAEMRGVGLSWLRVLRSEWTKFRTLRSTYIILTIAVILFVGLAVIIAYSVGTLFERGEGPEMEITVPVEALDAVLGGLLLAQLAIGVFGVSIGTNEYSTGMIRATLAAVPRRWPVITAKAFLVFMVTLLVMIPAGFAAFLLGQAIVSQYGLVVSLSQDGVIRALFGTGLYLGGVAVLGLAVGMIVRSAAGGIAILVGVLILLPVVLPLIQFDWITDIHPYLPSEAGQLIYQIVPRSDVLTPWTGYAVMVAYCVVLIGIATYLLRRRDA